MKHIKITGHYTVKSDLIKMLSRLIIEIEGPGLLSYSRITSDIGGHIEFNCEEVLLPDLRPVEMSYFKTFCPTVLSFSGGPSMDLPKLSD